MSIIVEPDQAVITGAWRLLFEPQQTVELRAITPEGKIRWAGMTPPKRCATQ